MLTSPSVDKITASLLEAQKKIKHATKDKTGPHAMYATLESVIDACKAVLLEQGIVVIQSPGDKVLTTRLQHKSGEFIQDTMSLILGRQDMQGLGSAITYARRYSLTSLLNMAQADDDGQLAGKAKPARVVTKTPIKKDSLQF